MAVANDKWNFVFLAEPHTASRAVRDALLKLEGSYKAGSHHIPIEALLNYNYLRRRKRHKYTTIATVRNPADIFVTLWMQSTGYRREIETLQEYIRRWGLGNTEGFFFRHVNDADQVIRYENLESDLNCILISLQAPPVQLEVVGKTEDKEPWHTYYTKLDLEYLLWRYPEIARWGYAETLENRIELLDKQS